MSTAVLEAPASITLRQAWSDNFIKALCVATRHEFNKRKRKRLSCAQARILQGLLVCFTEQMRVNPGSLPTSWADAAIKEIAAKDPSGCAAVNRFFRHDIYKALRRTLRREGVDLEQIFNGYLLRP